MPSNPVRASRDGDEFHYLWAARRCLQLLSPLSGIVAITIEGASPSETSAESRVEVGDELIDVAEYHGSEDIARATLIRYVQLKHSTLRAADPWPPNGLEKTLKGFAQRYEALRQRFGTQSLTGKLEFWFVSNRPIGSDFLETVYDAANGALTRHTENLGKLEKFTGLNGSTLSEFCKLLRLEGKQDGYWDQRNILVQDVSGYLPEADVDAPTQLKELVRRKALSENEKTPTITKIDVLRALKTDESRLLPAPCLIEEIEGVVPREQEANLIGSIVRAASIPVILHAEGGVGKSVFATRIKYGLPEGSLAILYDCFGNGQYRSASGYRHRHKDALVQITNELAGKGLCHPLIPTPNAEPAEYSRAFLHRLKQSITSLRAENATALLCIIIDAADNAQIAAEEIGEARSFVLDLLREQIPEGVRLIALCRTHRQALLNPPPNALSLELLPFNRTETAKHLRHSFPDATDYDVDEFHRLSSHNPRVQALALSWKSSLAEILRKLGPNPTTVEDAIGNLLDESILKLRDAAGSIEKYQIERICSGLAALRPLIPISVLSSMSGVDEAAIKSFAFDLGRPLIVTGDTIQFFDEPAETWFRERFKPKATDLAAFVESLRPLASTSAYVSSALPQLMLEAGHFAELVTLALSPEALPEGSPLERRDVELQRLQFALKASLRAKRFTDATKLALKAGGESAGDERQRKLLQTNTDLAAVFMDTDSIQEIVSRRTFGSGWVGSHHAYEAGLMSGRDELLADARSRLRMAYEWLMNWSSLSREEKNDENITDDDIAEMAMANFNIHGAASCARSLRGWRPRKFSFRAARILARRFIDHGRFQDLDYLTVAAENDLCLILAVTLELQEVRRYPPKNVVERALRLVLNSRVNLKDPDSLDSKDTVLQAVTALVEAAYRWSVRGEEDLASLLTRYLPPSPPRGLSSRFGGSRGPFLRAYALRAALSRQSLNLIDLAHPELKKELEKKNSHHDTQDAQEFKAGIGALLPWYQLWAETFLGRRQTSSIAAAIEDTKSASSKATNISYREESYTSDEIAQLWLGILCDAGATDTASTDGLNQWINSQKRPLYTPTLTHLARLAARTDQLGTQSFAYATNAFELTEGERADAESKSDTYIDLARAILTVSQSEAAAYFNKAVEVASKIGDENLHRWSAILDLADRAAIPNQPAPETAYKLARCAELTYEYVARDKYFEWEATVRAIAGLCPSSSLAILSRWRDRDFGVAERLLPVMIGFLLERGNLDPKAALALVGFRAQWDETSLLKSALDACTTKADKQTASNFLYRYMMLDGQSSRKWRALKDLSVSHGLVLPDIDELIIYNERKEQSEKSADDAYRDERSLSESKEKRDWNAIFAGIDLSVANDISLAHLRFLDFDPPYYHDHFFKEAYGRVIVGKEAEFITAIAESADFELYHFRTFLEQVPKEWRNRLAVQTALASTLKTFCRRYCMEITKSRYYQMFPLKLVCELSGIAESDIVDVVLSAIGEAAELVGVSRLFTLVGLLATKLSHIEASDALSFGLNLFDSALENKDGDGPWSAVLTPPTEIEGALAGYVWAGLGAPKISVRWEAAHVVRGLCVLGQEKVLDHLIALAKAPSGGPFVDARLYFYQLDACQWLLIALARAAKDTPNILIRHADFFIQLALNGEPHVLIRGFAARTALTLLDGGVLNSKSDLRQRLKNVNTSTLPQIASKYYERTREQHKDTTASTKQDRFYFGIDMSPYWFDPLGRCFAKSQSEIEHEVQCVIADDWKYSGTLHWGEDERVRRKIFRDGETYHSHGSYPRVSDLRFYLSYHAMMVVAGKLLATVPVHHDPDDPEDDFSNWLLRHGLSRVDENWRADRRDPIPLEWPSWKNDKQTDDWRWSICRSDFDTHLTLPGGRLNLWGRWTFISGSREESVHISSALVSSCRSEALLRALQTATNPHDFRIPDAGDHLEIDREKFQLKGWIADRHPNSGLDDQDPWAGGISYPPVTPAPFVLDVMHLSTDSESRVWRVQNGKQEENALWSQVWGYYREKDDETEKESGSRIQGSFRFVLEFLRKIDMDLIIEVEIERQLRRPRYESYKEDDLGFIPPSARFFLVKSNGNVCTI